MKRYVGQIWRGLVGIGQTYTELSVPLSSNVPQGILGNSVSGKSITYYKIGTGSRKIACVSGTHGNEVGTVKLGHRLIDWLWRHQTDFAGCTFFIIPCLNVDGYQKALAQPDYFRGGRIGRFNGKGVDLNRNFPTRSFQPETIWTHGKRYTEETKVFAGTRGASEPEIKGLLELIQNEGIEIYFAFHSAGRDVMGSTAPLGQKLAQTFSKVAQYRFCSLDEWKKLGQTGTAKEWCDENKIAYVEVEATTRWGSDWHNQKPGLEACFRLVSGL